MVPWYWVVLAPVILFLLLVLVSWFWTLIPYEPHEPLQEDGKRLEEELLYPEERED
jgi:hypothetical protein